MVVGNDITRAGCMAHAWRKFVDAEKTHPAIAAEAVGIIKRLYAVEDRGKGLDVRQRLALRQQESTPIPTFYPRSDDDAHPESTPIAIRQMQRFATFLRPFINFLLKIPVSLN